MDAVEYLKNKDILWKFSECVDDFECYNRLSETEIKNPNEAVQMLEKYIKDIVDIVNIISDIIKIKENENGSN